MHNSKNTNQADIKAIPCHPVADITELATRSATSLRQDDPAAIEKVRREIESASAQHLELMNEMQRTRHAVYTVENNQRTVSYLEEELRAQTKLAEEAAQATINQLERCRKAKISTPKNWNRKSSLSAEYIGPAQDPKQAYYQALAIQSKAEQRAKELEVDAGNLEREIAGVIDLAERHGDAQKQIEEMYSRIFDGRTPGFPEEDALEECYKRRRNEHSETTATLEETVNASKSLAKLPLIFNRIEKNINEARAEMERCHRFSGVSYVAVLVERASDLIDMAQTQTKKAVDTIPKPHTPDLIKEQEKLEDHLRAARSCALSTNKVAYAWVTPKAADYAITVITREVQDAREVLAGLTKVLRKCELTASTAFQATARSLNQAKESLTEMRQSIFEDVGHVASAPPYRHNDSDDDPIIDASGLPPPPVYASQRC